MHECPARLEQPFDTGAQDSVDVAFDVDIAGDLGFTEAVEAAKEEAARRLRFAQCQRDRPRR